MDNEQSKLVEELQVSINELALRFDQLSDRLDTIERNSNQTISIKNSPARTNIESGDPKKRVKKPPFNTQNRVVLEASSPPAQPQYNPDPLKASTGSRSDARRDAFKRLEKQPVKNASSEGFDFRKLEWLLGTRGHADCHCWCWDVPQARRR